MDDKFFQNSSCITSMKQKLSGPIEAHGPFIVVGNGRFPSKPEGTLCTLDVPLEGTLFLV